jgi:hypothetical protein
MCRAVVSRPGAVEIVPLDSQEQGNDDEWQEDEFESESDIQLPIRTPESELSFLRLRPIHSVLAARQSFVSGSNKHLGDIEWGKATPTQTRQDP